MERHDLKKKEKEILDLMIDEGRVTPDLVAHRHGNSTQYIRNIMPEMKRDGLVTTVEPVDGLYELTTEGRRLAETRQVARRVEA